jgi:CO/xanthine dehydrogenase Mo-binding subunit
MNETFIDDLSLPGMITIRPLFSTIPRGTILDIRFPEDLPDVHLFREDEIPGSPVLDVYGEKIPVLADKEVNYLGEPICLFYSDNAANLERAEKNVVVDYESDYIHSSFEQPGDDQLFGDQEITQGNTEKAFAAASQIIEGEYHQEDPVQDCPAPIGALVSEEENTLHVRVSTLWPEHVKKCVAEALNISPRQVIVTPTNPFPTDGEKLMLPAILAVWAALCCRKSGKAARIAWDVPPRNLPFLRSPRSHISFQSAVDEAGHVIGEKVEALMDLGAFSFLSTEVLSRLALGIAGSRYTPAFSIKVKGVRTNLSPTRVRCGFGISQGLFARELHDTRVAHILGKNPALYRIERCTRGKLPSGGIINPQREKSLLDMVCSESDFYRKHAAYGLVSSKNPIKAKKGVLRGIGIAAGYTGDGFSTKPQGRDQWSVSAVLDRNDHLILITKAASFPGSVRDLWKVRAGEILGIDPDSIALEEGDNQFPGIGPLICGQRLAIATTLIEQCCNAIKKQRFQEPLPIRIKKSYRSPSSTIWEKSSMKGTPFHRLSWGAMVAEVEIDPLSLHPLIRGIWVTAACGKIHNKNLAESEVRSSLMKTIRRCNNGDNLLTRRMRETGIHSETDQLFLVPMHISFIEDKQAPSSGLSQLAGALFPAAYIAALSQSTGLFLDTLPLTPDLIHSYLVREAE